mgnify:CR=1 FL=1
MWQTFIPFEHFIASVLLITVMQIKTYKNLFTEYYHIWLNWWMTNERERERKRERPRPDNKFVWPTLAIFFWAQLWKTQVTYDSWALWRNVKFANGQLTTMMLGKITLAVDKHVLSSYWSQYSTTTLGPTFDQQQYFNCWYLSIGSMLATASTVTMTCCLQL